MIDPNIIKIAFKSIFLLLLLLSFYIFIVVVAVKDTRYKDVFSAWQFPMILALIVDLYIIE
jgi:hypothetical protein